MTIVSSSKELKWTILGKVRGWGMKQDWSQREREPEKA